MEPQGTKLEALFWYTNRFSIFIERMLYPEKTWTIIADPKALPIKEPPRKTTKIFKISFIL